MELIFDDTVFVHYRFVLLSPAGEEDPDLDESNRGEVNGLLGAAAGDALSMTTGTTPETCPCVSSGITPSQPWTKRGRTRWRRRLTSLAETCGWRRSTTNER